MNDRERLPPGQQLVSASKWPIIGERQPAHSDLPWTLTLTGLVENEQLFSLEQLKQLPQSEITIDLHCVTRWSKFDVTFRGVMMETLLEHCGVLDEAKFVSFTARSTRDHATSMTLQDSLAYKTLIALEVDGQDLPLEHGGPIRNIVEGKYFYKSVKWLREIKLLSEDQLGFWEAETGYHNGADPWLEQRYMAPSIDRKTAIRLIQSKDFSNKDLRSISARDMDLNGLNASNALLRDADFKNTSLNKSNFSKANLSNAHFENADLRYANLVGADLEGANFSEADLRSANLTNCSLIGASFCKFDDNGQAVHGARFDSQSVIPKDILTPLTPQQSDYVNSQLKNK